MGNVFGFRRDEIMKNGKEFIKMGATICAFLKIFKG
jgi:hypothetical protein